jgi:UPF0716 protein FxsA
MFLLLVILFIVGPIAELAVIITVGQQIGVVPTIALLLVVGAVGAWLGRRQGSLAWRRFQEAMDAGRVPTAEIADGAMVLLAGALLIAPGFISDVLAIALLVPAVRSLLRRTAVVWFMRRRTRGVRVVDGRSRTTTTWGRPETHDRSLPPRSG